MSSWCIKTEPQVIDSAMIKVCLEEMAKAGEVGRLQKEEGIPVEEVLEIRFEFKKILRMEYLWVLKSLTKLSLNNNLIETMQNLDKLIHLKELNLSFNKISKIENLNNLVNLEILNLFQNKIKVIENLDNLSKLMIFSLGNNLVVDRRNIIYLRKFNNLKSFNMVGNPCAKDESFRVFVAALLPKLVYYEYIFINEDEREFGKNLFSSLLMEVEEREIEESVYKLKREKEKADAKIHSLSYVEYLGGSFLFDLMYKEDLDGNLLLLLGDDIAVFYDEFKEEFVQNCIALFEYGQEQYAIREEEIKQYKETVETAKKKGQLQSIEMMEEFLEKKNIIFQTVSKLSRQYQKNELPEDIYLQKIHEIAESFNGQLHEIWRISMQFEVTIFGQMEEVNQLFELSLTDHINTFIEYAQGIFTYLRTLENIYYDNITELTFKILSSEDPDVPKELKEIFANKDSLSNALGASHDIHLQTIDKREDKLVERARTWLKGIVDNLESDEIKRNRMKILEISHFVNIQKEEFEHLDIFLPESQD